MTSTDITPAEPTGLAILDDPEAFDIVKDSLVGVDSLLAILPRATITGTGPAAFQVGDTETAQELQGVIVDASYSRRYFMAEFSGGGELPDCSSLDGKTGTGVPGGACATCPLNQYVEGGGKACGEYFNLAILPEGDLLPVLVSVPPSSLKAWQRHRLMLGTRAPRRRPEDVVTKLTVTKSSTKNRDNVNVIRFETIDTLSVEARAGMAGYVEELRPQLQRSLRDDLRGADYESAVAAAPQGTVEDFLGDKAA